jgi:hypothetical protein
MHREGDDQFRFATAFEPVLVGLACVLNLFDDFAELVDLDGEDALVLPRVGFFLDGITESLIELLDSLAKQILESNDDGSLQSFALGFFNNVGNSDAPFVSGWLDAEEAIRVDGVVRVAPATQTIEVIRVGDGPSFGFLRFQIDSKFGS